MAEQIIMIPANTKRQICIGALIIAITDAGIDYYWRNRDSWFLTSGKRYIILPSMGYDIDIRIGVFNMKTGVWLEWPKWWRKFVARVLLQG